MGNRLSHVSNVSESESVGNRSVQIYRACMNRFSLSYEMSEPEHGGNRSSQGYTMSGLDSGGTDLHRVTQ